MKKLILFILLVFPVLTTFAQIRPPQQTDTIYISSVKYNYADIRQENWPCSVIYKSTTSFKIGEDEFTILKASKSLLDVVDFVVTDKEGKERYNLTYIEGVKYITVKFSGYEFICRKILNGAQEATVGNKGDVEVSEPPCREISKRNLFTAADNKAKKDTLAAQTSREITDALKAGHASGNIKDGNTSGVPNSKLAGRTVIGALPRPPYNVTESGKVVVKIKVNRDGTVVEAQPGAEGTNLTNKTAWEAAKKAALKTQFNMKPDAAEFQYGTITYIF